MRTPSRWWRQSCGWGARWLPPRTLFALLLLGQSLTAGCTEARSEEETKPPQLEPKKKVEPPKGFEGPIDPEWPPTHPERLQVLLESSKLLREQSAAKNGAETEVVIPRDRAGLHVEAGKIGDISYLEVIIGDAYSPDDPMPLGVILHGRGGKAHIPKGPFHNKVPVRLFIPQGPDKLGKGYNWLATWTNSGKTQLLSRSLSARADQLAPVIEAFRRMRPTLGKPIVTGFSQGGILSFALATRHPNQFAAAFPICGWLPPALYPERKANQEFPYIYAQHGGNDRVVPTAKGRATVSALRARGLRVDYREEKGAAHVVTNQMDREVRRAMARIWRAYGGSVRTQVAVRGPRRKASPSRR